jgi:hypothetical protein
MKILYNKLPKISIVVFMVAGILIGTTLAFATSPIWSNITSSTISQNTSGTTDNQRGKLNNLQNIADKSKGQNKIKKQVVIMNKHINLVFLQVK